MNFRGTFKPPAVTITHSPARIAGPGRCNVGRKGLEISGFEASSRARLEALLIIALVVSLAGFFGFAADRLLTAVPSIALQLAGGAIGGLVYFFVIGGRDKHLADKPVDRVIPWERVGAATRDMRQPGVVAIEVTEGSSKETLYFLPAEGPDLFLNVFKGAVSAQDRS
ncbi:MAG TPA: hypothetical protein VE093_00350 [Polyangiaceae bacterium]|jgi:hypothetical protein|nr:hypothetical protein [Polyangiaceae bacterium]